MAVYAAMIDTMDQNIGRLVAALDEDGLFLSAIAGRDNSLYRFWEHGFAELEEPIPYWLAEDVEAVLKNHGVTYQKAPSPYELVFPDTRENRLKIIRFLCADHLRQMDVEALLRLFDEFSQGERIEIRTSSRQFAIAK